MDKKTFDKAIQISEAIKSLEIINKRIKDANLSFVIGRSYDAVIALDRKEEKVIREILSKHEAGIRRDIEDRYNNLKKQLEEL